MKKEQMPRYAFAFAVLIVGLAFAGVPLSSLLFIPLVLACPLMMMFMMGGMGGMGASHKQDSELNHADRDRGPARDARLAQLEREVAELRASKDRSGTGRS
jgi:hypothetical protein